MRNSACSQKRENSLPVSDSDCAISFSWWGKIRSTPPAWISSVSPRYLMAITEHSMCQPGRPGHRVDRKSTRLNSSHLGSSYAVFCLKKNHTAAGRRSGRPAGCHSRCPPRWAWGRLAGGFHRFFFNDTAPNEIYTLSLHDALPISLRGEVALADRGFPGLGGLPGTTAET